MTYEEKVQESYEEVLDLVSGGLSIYKSIKFVGLSRPSFYKYITPSQKAELNRAKTSHSLYSSGSLVKAFHE